MADTLRQDYLIERLVTAMGGVHDWLPLDVIPPNACARLQNIEVFGRGTSRRRGGLTQWKDYASGLTANAWPRQLRQVILRGHGPALVGVTDVTDTTTAFLVDDGSPSGLISMNALGQVSEDGDLVAILDRVYVLQPGQQPRFWQWGRFQLAYEAGGNTAFPNASTAIYFKGRAWAGGDPAKADLVYFSSALGNSQSKSDPFTWDQTFQAFRASTGRVTKLIPYRNFALLVFTDRGIEVIEPDDCNINDSTRNVISTVIGCGAKHTVQIVGEDIMWMDQDGEIRSLAHTQSDEARGVTNVPVSQAIRRVIARQTKDRLFTARAVVFQGFYMVSFPVDGALFPNETWIYSVRDQAWEGPFRFGYDGVSTTPSETQDRYISALEICRFEGDAARLYAFIRTPSNVARVYHVFRGRTDDGTAIPIEMVTRDIFHGDPRQTKTWNHLEIEARFIDATVNTSMLTLALSVRTNEGGWVSLGTFTLLPDAGPTLTATLPFQLSPYTRQRIKTSLFSRNVRGAFMQARIECRDIPNLYEFIATEVSAQQDNTEFS